LPDLLTEIRRDIDRRLDELRPVLEEFRMLEQAQDALATSPTPRRSRRGGRAKAAPKRSSNSRPARTRMTRARSQEIDRRVVALLAEDPHQKPAALALLTETTAASMSSRLRRLAREGKLTKHKRGAAVRYEVRPTSSQQGDVRPGRDFEATVSPH